VSFSWECRVNCIKVIYIELDSMFLISTKEVVIKIFYRVSTVNIFTIFNFQNAISKYNYHVIT
jgi:hypothetical protein